MKIDGILEQGIKHIYPDVPLEESLKKMVQSEIKRKLLSFELVDVQYKKKYEMEFEVFFKSTIEDKKPDYDAEQDYFNWEMAVTATRELKKDLDKINSQE